MKVHSKTLARTAGILGGWSLKSASSRARTTSTLQSNNPTARVGKNTSPSNDRSKTSGEKT